MDSSLPKEEMVQQILELQQTLEDLNTHVTKVDAENTALVEENNVLKVSASVVAEREVLCSAACAAHRSAFHLWSQYPCTIRLIAPPSPHSHCAPPVQDYIDNLMSKQTPKA